MATKVLLVAIALNGRTIKIAGPFSYSNAWTFVETTLDLIGKTGIEMGLEIFDHSTKEERQSFVTTRDGATFIELGKKNWNRTPPIRFEFTLHTWYQQSSASEPSNDEGNRPTIVDIENMVENATLEYYNTHQKQLMVENACKNSAKLHADKQNKIKDPTDLPNKSDSEYESDAITDIVKLYSQRPCIKVFHGYNWEERELLRSFLQRLATAAKETLNKQPHVPMPQVRDDRVDNGQHPFGYDKE